jgi:hypothetical protein
MTGYNVTSFFLQLFNCRRNGGNSVLSLEVIWVTGVANVGKSL